MGSAAANTASIPHQVLFWFLAAAIIGGAIFTMTRRNPVTAVMSLVGTFFALAALYASLDAHFLAIIQILVYAGAIMVLFIFVVMILNREEATPVTMRGLLIRSVGVVAALYLVLVFVRIVGTSSVAGPPPSVPDTFGTVASIGDVLFRDFVYPFEAISLLLLVAIVGGVTISRSQRKEAAAEHAAEARKAVQQMAHADYPAADTAALESGHGTSSSGGGGGHH
ncbi:MAG TPA: NADH-quinone oxidoreductase subunit J [Polyangia bacterium]|jgi:NADH-quinone oxidoreductase subunit J|nr:NADH-quinone oxidoreductase subunit J [Polyangia bacterium]